ncbi:MULTISPECIES: HAD family hydrolase [Rufibacter]|uniref:phosphoglycolate phosphatase n=1 Tax=Rufibacter quisquiliarum TaxID=1549639 RepID=A0A839GJG3_9BACT|nr:MULTISPECIES: HAD family hydrolase [Rufibacter]MBA9079002.1 phosphoglycolate phosphatase [Rufibacter quisquiliarum]
MLPYQVLIFDFDGTLCATQDSILYTFQKTFEHQGVTPPGEQQVKEGISTGANLWEMLPLLHPPLREEEKHAELAEWVHLYRTIYDTDGGRLTTLFDGAEPLLKNLKELGLACAVISNKGQQAIEDALLKFNLRPYFDLVIGDNPALPLKKKPHPMAFHQVIQPHYPQAKNNQFLMVGDTHADLEFANNAGIASCWATFGYGNTALCHKANPTFAIDRLPQLLPLLNPDG